MSDHDKVRRRERLKHIAVVDVTVCMREKAGSYLLTLEFGTLLTQYTLMLFFISTAITVTLCHTAPDIKQSIHCDMP